MSKNLTIEQITAIAVQAAVAAVAGLVDAPKAPKASKASTKTEVAFSDLRNALKAHKASGAIVAGVSVKQAIEQGLMTETGALPGKASKPAKKGKASKKVEEGTPFHTLQLRLREHKAAGLVVPGVSVRQAQAEGLIDEDGNFVGTTPKASKPASKKASKKGSKTEKVAAKVEADSPAKVRAADGPRRADGSITPKTQWDLRESLADSGKFDRHEIDAIVEPGRA